MTASLKIQQLSSLQKKEVRAYTFLVGLVICGLAGSLITASKIVYFGINFPFSNLVFSIFTYPIVDCICELWGKQAARQALWFGLGGQLLLTLIIQLSIMAPHATFWHLQTEYQKTLSIGLNVVMASCIAFAISQVLDIVVYQKLKEFCQGKKLWIRSNLSTYLGQAVDSILFVNIVFYHLDQKTNIMLGSIMVKVILSFLMTPIVYLIVYGVHRYLDSHTLAFKAEHDVNLI